MEHFINNISIRNFKSIQECEIQDCRRINLFIGRPNVGKSNILEALSIFSLPFLAENKSKKMNQMIRLENEAELFYEGNTKKLATTITNVGNANLRFDPKMGLSIELWHNDISSISKVDEKLNVRNFVSKDQVKNIRAYRFSNSVEYDKGHARYLIPPFGTNLLSIIEHYPELKVDVTRFFADYNLEIAFDQASQSIKILKRKEDGIFLIPYSSVADTLQRIIFYKAAIASNDNSILLFEEPEAHSFPPYMTHFTQELIRKKDNQYFIATHSPYVVNDLLENAQHELAIFNVDFKDKQTVVHRLSDTEMHEAFQFGVDLFTNNESYL